MLSRGRLGSAMLAAYDAGAKPRSKAHPPVTRILPQPARETPRELRSPPGSGASAGSRVAGPWETVAPDPFAL